MREAGKVLLEMAAARAAEAKVAVEKAGGARGGGRHVHPSRTFVCISPATFIPRGSVRPGA